MIQKHLHEMGYEMIQGSIFYDICHGDNVNKYSLHKDQCLAQICVTQF